MRGGRMPHTEAHQAQTYMGSYSCIRSFRIHMTHDAPPLLDDYNTLENAHPCTRARMCLRGEYTGFYTSPGAEYRHWYSNSPNTAKHPAALRWCRHICSTCPRCNQSRCSAHTTRQWACKAPSRRRRHWQQANTRLQ